MQVQLLAIKSMFGGGMNVDRLTIPDEPIEGGMRRAIVDARAVKEQAMTLYWKLKKSTRTLAWSQKRF